MLIMGHGLANEDLENNPLYKSKAFYKYIPKTKGLEDALLKDNQLQEFAKENLVEIIPENITDINEGLDFLLNKKGHENVFVERNAVKLQKYFETPEADPPFNLFFMTIYQGKVERDSLGSTFPPLTKILEKYTLLHMSPGYLTDDGTITIFTFAKKTGVVGKGKEKPQDQAQAQSQSQA